MNRLQRTDGQTFWCLSVWWYRHDTVKEYVKAFQSFNDVVHACYRDELEVHYAEKLLKMAKINKIFEKLLSFSSVNWKLSQKALK